MPKTSQQHRVYLCFYSTCEWRLVTVVQKPGRMFVTVGLWLWAAPDATIQKNINDICCTWKWGIVLPLGIRQHDSLPHCFSQRTERLRVAETQRDLELEQRETVCPETLSASNLPLFSSEAAPPLQGEFDGQLSVCQSIMWFLSHNRILSAPLLISLLFRRMKIHIPPSHKDMSLSLPARLEEKWISFKWNTHKRKTIQPNRGESAPGILSQTKPEIVPVLWSVAKLRARTVNWRRSIAIKRKRGSMANSMNKSAAVITDQEPIV